PGKAVGTHGYALHVPFPFTSQRGAGLQVCDAAAKVHGTLRGLLRRPRTVEETFAIAIEVAQLIGLQPIGKNAKQQMAGQVRGRSPTEYVLPTAPKRIEIEVTQARYLDVERLSVGQFATVLNARHGALMRPPLELTMPGLAAVAARNLIDAITVY